MTGEEMMREAQLGRTGGSPGQLRGRSTPEKARTLRSESESLEALWDGSAQNKRPRELNVEADALTNEDFSGVDMKRRIQTTWDLLSSRLELLLKLLKLQQEFSTSMELLKSSPVMAGGRPHKKAKTSKSVWG